MRKPIIKKGDKFNRLTAIKFSHKNKRSQQCWFFRCDCGSKKLFYVHNVKNGATKSCGCFKKEGIGDRTHGMTKTRTYKSWQSMKVRCLKKDDKNYKNYGSRGITICEEWMKFENFYRDMGERPQGKTLDRIENNGNYCKENCRWATRKEQQNNRRNTVFLTFNNKTQTMSQWSEELKIDRHILWTRINKLNWSVKKALTL